MTPALDLGKRPLAVGDTVVTASVKRFGKFSAGRFAEHTITKIGRTGKLTLSGKATPVASDTVVLLRKFNAKEWVADNL